MSAASHGRAPLPLAVRLLHRAEGLLRRTGLVPDAHEVLTRSAADRTALSAPAVLLGAVPAVPYEDVPVPTRDGATVRVRVYRPDGASDQPVLYVHGGGFAVGGIASCDHVCRRLAAEAGAVVLSVEYRLAPEHRFPGPLHDCLDAVAWLGDRAAELAIDPAQLVVAGDSAGGNLAAAVAVVLRDQGRPLAGQLLVYPGVDLSMSLPGVSAYDGVGLTTEDVRLCVRTYLGDQDPTQPYASPWYADPTGLAPALVLTAGHDPLHDEGVAYAEKLLAAGVPTRHLDLPGHVHGSLSVPRLYPGIDRVFGEMATWLRSVRAGQPA